MRLHRAKRRYGVDINMTPMIDVIFQLLIFFMCATQMAQLEVEELQLPEARQGLRDERLPSGPLIVNVDRDGRIVVAQKALTPAGLRAEVERVARTQAAAAGGGAGRTTAEVIVRGDRQAAWAKVAEAMDACASANVNHVKVAVIEPPGAGGP